MTNSITHDISRDAFMLKGNFASEGYDWWWHNFTATSVPSGRRKTFFIEYFTCNPALGGGEPVFGQIPGRPQKPSYMMVKCGAWGEPHCQLHRFFGWNEVKIGNGVPFSIDAADCHADETRLKGSVDVRGSASHPEWMCDDGSMSWDLDVEKVIPFNVGFGANKHMRDHESFDMFWHAEGVKSRFSGWVILNGEKFLVDPDTSYGYADKNWGRDFTSPWVWIASSNLTSRLTGRKLENSALEIGGGRPKAFGIALNRKLLGEFVYEGTPYEFNFSKLWTGSRTEFSSEETQEYILWHVRQENRHNVLETEVRCRRSEMILANYEAPDGSKKHNRLWNGGTGTGEVRLYRKTLRGIELIDDILAANIGCEYGEYC